MHAGIAVQARYVLTGNAQMIKQKDIVHLATGGPPGIPEILRRDAILATFGKRLGLQPRDCIEQALVATSPNHRNYPALMRRVLPALKASFPETVAEMEASERNHQHFTRLHAVAKPTPGTTAAQRARSG